MSVATARRIEHDPRPPSAKAQRRQYRTRPDPLAGLWAEEIVPLLQAAPGLRPVTLFAELARRHPERIGLPFRRTLERRVMVATRNNRGVAHENGAIESRHGHAKQRIAQALLLRGSAAFDCLDDYRAFVANTIAQHNRRHAAMIDAERATLRRLPAAPATTWDEMTVRVTTASGFMCRHVFYTVPSRLIGHRLRLRLHDERIDAYLGGEHVLTLPRGRRAKGTGAVHIVNYRHVIAALRAKPGALTHLAYRDALWPREAFRRAFDALAAAGPAREAARTMVGLLALAHDRGVEADLAAALDAEVDAGALPDLATMMQRFTPPATAAPTVSVIIPPAASYDSLLPCVATALAPQVVS